jgi:outer membrane protein W
MKSFNYPAAIIGLALSLACLPAASEESHRVAIGGGIAIPSNGTGWITEHLETGLAVDLDYSYKGAKKYGFYINARMLDHDVDVSDTTMEDDSITSTTTGTSAGIKYWFLSKNKLDLYAGAGIGFYNSELKADGSTEDSSSGSGLDLNIGANVNFTSLLFLNARVDYLTLMMGEGASYDDLSVVAGLGFSF